ncbi:glutamate-rich protein 5 [Pseudomonas putida]|uniref:DUF4573 domain-containing protein n=1 Tax=Pseudomonas putida TaxID=303 RepID=UPI002363C615|nr:DUF4573 domain-containing protein [Pseudomonas putida]MDD2054058.1 glutamate-rich protein 5 [Pseudomonas putida]
MKVDNSCQVGGLVFYGAPLDGDAVSGRVAAVPGSLSDKELSMINDQGGAAQLARRREDVSPEALSSENAVLVNDGGESLSGQTVTLPAAGSVVPAIFSSRPAKPLPPLPVFQPRASAAEHIYAEAIYADSTQDKAATLSGAGPAVMRDNSVYVGASNARPAQPLPQVSGSQSGRAEPIYDVLEAEPIYDVLEAEPIYDVLEAEPIYDVLEAEPIYDVLEEEPIYDVLEAEPIYDALEAEPIYDVLEAEPIYDVLEAEPIYDVLEAEPIYDVLENVESIDDGPSEESGKSTALL